MADLTDVDLVMKAMGLDRAAAEEFVAIAEGKVDGDTPRGSETAGGDETLPPR